MMKISFFYVFTLIFFFHTALGMERDESPMRVETPRVSTSRDISAMEEWASTPGSVSPTPPSSPEVEMNEGTSSPPADLSLSTQQLKEPLGLSLFTDQLKKAVEDVDVEEINRLSNVFKDKETLSETEWQREAEERRALRWHLQPPSWKAVVGGELFFSVLDEPHLNLIRQALQPLKDLQGESEWERAYEISRTHVSGVIKKHTRLHHLGLLQSLAVSASFNHPIARLIVVDYMHLLNEGLQFVSKDAPDFLNQNHRFISLALKGSREALTSFLEPDTIMFVDLEGESLKDQEKVLAKSQLGLSYYDMLLGNMLLMPAIKNASSESIQEALEYYKFAWKKDDPKAPYIIAHTLRVAGIENKIPFDGKRYHDSLQNAYEMGFWGAYGSLYSDLKEKDKRIWNHYNTLKIILGGKR